MNVEVKANLGSSPQVCKICACGACALHVQLMWDFPHFGDGVVKFRTAECTLDSHFR